MKKNKETEHTVKDIEKAIDVLNEVYSYIASNCPLFDMDNDIDLDKSRMTIEQSLYDYIKIKNKEGE